VAVAAVVAKTSGVRVLTMMAGTAVAGCRGAAPDRGFVTAAATNTGVRAAEREVGLRIVIELPRLPVRRIVAIGALVTETAVMRIVAGVAGETVGIGVKKCGGGMTLVARDVGVRTHQRKINQIVVEPYFRGPAGRNVTAFTLRPQLAFVLVVAGVAATAALRQFVVDIAFMASRTFERLMPRRQCHTGIPRMIEIHRTPAGIDMAAGAVAAVAGFVYIIGTMTGVAVGAAAIAEVSAVVAVLAA